MHVINANYLIIHLLKKKNHCISFNKRIGERSLSYIKMHRNEYRFRSFITLEETFPSSIKPPFNMQYNICKLNAPSPSIDNHLWHVLNMKNKIMTLQLIILFFSFIHLNCNCVTVPETFSI